MFTIGKGLFYSLYIIVKKYKGCIFGGTMRYIVEHDLYDENFKINFDKISNININDIDIYFQDESNMKKFIIDLTSNKHINCYCRNGNCYCENGNCENGNCYCEKGNSNCEKGNSNCEKGNSNCEKYSDCENYENKWKYQILELYNSLNDKILKIDVLCDNNPTQNDFTINTLFIDYETDKINCFFEYDIQDIIEQIKTKTAYLLDKDYKNKQNMLNIRKTKFENLGYTIIDKPYKK